MKKQNKKIIISTIALALLIQSGSYAIGNKNIKLSFGNIKNMFHKHSSVSVNDSKEEKAEKNVSLTKDESTEKIAIEDNSSVTPAAQTNVQVAPTDITEEEILLNAKDEDTTPYTNDVHSAFTLEDCIKIAVEYNPSIRSAVYAEQAAKTKIGQAWSNYFPVLSAGVGVKREGTRFTKGISASQYNSSFFLPNFSGSMLLFDFGKTKASADSAQRTFEAKKSDTNESVNVLLYYIKTAYHNVLFAQAQVAVYKDTVADYELQLKSAESLYAVGKKAKIDVITAQYNLGKAQLNLVKAENILDVARVQLVKVMGIPKYTNYELVTPLGTKKYDITEDNAINKAYEVRPELISAQKKLEAAQLQVRAAKRGYTPDLGLNGGYGNGWGNEFDELNFHVGVELKYNNFNFMKTKKLIDEASATYNKQIADYDDVKHGLYLSVKKAYLELKTSEEAIVIAKLALDEAKEQYRQASGRYKAGVADYIELKDGETTYLNARLDFYNTLLEYNNCAANLEKEMGTPLSITNENVIKL